MLSTDIIVLLILMSVLFLRHISVFKNQYKINYIPLVAAIGTVGSLGHFAFFSNEQTWLLTLQESLILASTGIILAVLMSVMTQTQQLAQQRREQMDINSILSQIEELKQKTNFFTEKLQLLSQIEDSTHEQFRAVFKEEIDSLNMIQANQKLFIGKIEAMLAQQHMAQEKFQEFTLTEIPSLDNVIHRHIDLLRISEQDHFNQLKQSEQESCDERKKILNELSTINEQLRIISKSSTGNEIASAIQEQMSKIVSEFAKQVQTLSSKSGSIATQLMENESILKGTREQSELIMQQMVLSAKQMKEIAAGGREVYESFKPLTSMFISAESMHKEFIQAKTKLNELIISLEAYEKHEYRLLRENLERVASEAVVQMQLFTDKLTIHETSQEPSAEQIRNLNQKVKMQRSYTVEQSE